MPATATVPAATPPAPLVSVVVPTYGRGATVLRTLDSVFAQSFSDYELIVVDDGSPDDTIERMRPLAEAGRLRLVVQANAGTAAARNRGLAEARGEFIAFLDDDDLWPEDKLAWQVAFLREHADVDIVGGLVELMEADERPREVRYDAFRPGPVEFESLFDGNQFESPGQWVGRTEVVRELGGFDLTYRNTGDYDFLLRAARLFHVVGVHRLALRYREHASNVSKNLLPMLAESEAVVRANLGHVPPAHRARAARTAHRFLFRYLGRRLLLGAWRTLRAGQPRRAAAVVHALAQIFGWPALRDPVGFLQLSAPGIRRRILGS